MPWVLVTRCGNSNAAANSHGVFISTLLRENINHVQLVSNSVNRILVIAMSVTKFPSFLGRFIIKNVALFYLNT